VTSPTSYQFPRPPPRVPPPNAPSPIPAVTPLRSGERRRPDPEIFDPIMEEPPTVPARSWRRPGRRDTNSIDSPSVMFYPSTTTVSSMDSDSPTPPMPFFTSGPRIPLPGASESQRRSIPPTGEELRMSRGRASTGQASTASSGILGSGIHIDPDTESDSDDDESTTTSSSSYDRLVRNVSLVRRGQVQMIRNPSLRRSVVPEVHFKTM
jgi:hypothetical protein